MDSYRVSTVDVLESHIASSARGPWQQQRCDSLHCHEEWWGSVQPIVVFSRVHEITISSPKWKRTNTTEMVQHKRWTYPYYRAVNTEHQQNGRADGVRRLQNIWQKEINEGATIMKVHICGTPVNKAISELSNCCHYISSNPCIWTSDPARRIHLESVYYARHSYREFNIVRNLQILYYDW